jgi:hypothetical protein
MHSLNAKLHRYKPSLRVGWPRFKPNIVATWFKSTTNLKTSHGMAINMALEPCGLGLGLIEMPVGRM